MTDFSAPEYQPDGSIRVVQYRFTGSPADGWEVTRAGKIHLRLGPGYQVVRVSHCGICSTDLARRHLPFPLPQVIGHEVVAFDDRGAPAVLEINASHAARRLDQPSWCGFCRAGLGTHCPERLVIGIHGLPGGFSPWLLAPVGSLLSVPQTISAATATLVEPFAAALHAVRALDPADGDRLAVLGAGRLGLLIIAALASYRARSGRRYEILAVTRRPERGSLASALGADEILDAARAGTMRDVADVVIESTGSPAGLGMAIRLATREVHVKSTTGEPALGLSHVTELVVDELSLVPFSHLETERTFLPSPPPRIAVLLGPEIPDAVGHDLTSRGLRVLRGPDGATLARTLAHDPDVPLAGADLALVTSLDAIDNVIRPRAGVEQGLVRARGTIAVVDRGQPREGLLRGVLDKGLRISTSRCGDLRSALGVLGGPPGILGQRLGEQLVTDVLPATRLATALSRAAARESVKVVVTHPRGFL